MLKFDRVATYSILAGAVISTVAFVAWKQKKTKKPKGDWRKVGVLSSVYIYPLKSGRHVELDEALTFEKGLKEIRQDNLLCRGDREFLVYRQDTHEVLTGRTYAKLLTINVVSISSDTVEFRCDDQTLQITVPTDYNNQEIMMHKKEMIPTVDCGDKASEWIKNVLEVDKPFRIGYWSAAIKSRRNIAKYHAKYLKVYKDMSNEYSGAYSDLSSYFLLTEASVRDLNSRLPEGTNKVSHMQFRPNFQINATEPYEEDNWEWIKIGDSAVFKKFKTCTRCAFTNLNPETLERNPEQPLKTLKSYRICTDENERQVEGTSPAFGIYIGLHESGKISPGDQVYVSN